MAGEPGMSTLGDVAIVKTGPFGSQLHAHDYLEQGVPVVMPFNIANRRIDTSAIARVAQADADRLSRHKIAVGDLVFSRRGEIDKCALVTPSEVGWLCGTGCLLARLDVTKADPSYVSFHISSAETREWLRAHAVGLVMPNLNTGILSRLPLRLPSLVEQRSISGVLTALDDRIEANRRMNKTLESVARALFKSWFIDFDPVRAKAAAQPTGLIAEIDGLFPSLLDESGRPTGWRTERLDHVLELSYGKALSAQVRRSGTVPVYGSGGRTGWHDESLVDGPGIIVGRKGTVGSLYWEDGAFFPIDTVFYVRSDLPLTYCFYRLQTLGLESMNTDAAVPGLNRGNAYRLAFTAPPAALALEFDRIVSVLRQRIKLNTEQSSTLAALRDLLLPKLMSGAIRVNDADQQLAAHL